MAVFWIKFYGCLICRPGVGGHCIPVCLAFGRSLDDFSAFFIYNYIIYIYILYLYMQTDCYISFCYPIASGKKKKKQVITLSCVRDVQRVLCAPCNNHLLEDTWRLFNF